MSNDVVEQTLNEAFPEVDPMMAPYGARVLVQLRAVKEKATKSGIVLVEETKETEKWNTMIGKVIAIGPLAFKKRESMEPWPEGSWAEIGDYVRVPRWTGDRWEVKIDQDTNVEFMLMNDHEVVAKLTCDPLTMRAFV